MPRIRFPRKSSLQYWPRKRAASSIARIRHWPNIKETKPAGFAGYKVGMTHGTITDLRPNSMTKGAELPVPLTIIECPPLKVIGIRCYKNDAYGTHTSAQILIDKQDKDVRRAIILPKKQTMTIEKLSADGCCDVRILVATQPGLTTIGAKKPAVFELGIGGAIAEKLNYAKAKFGKEITVQEVFSEGNQIDTHAVTKGKGVQGPVQRHGVDIRHHKSEKTKRGPGSLGPWHGTRNWPVAHAGQTGFQQRTEFNKWLLKINTEPAKINPKGGWVRYGLVKNHSLLFHGSTGGANKRLITLTHALRPNKTIPSLAPKLSWICQESKQ